MAKKEAAILFIIAFLLPLVSASFILNSSNIHTFYAPSGNLKGSLNISFTNEPADSIIRSNFLGSISLKELLDANTRSYSCIPSDCRHDYLSRNASETKSFSLNAGEEKIVSFMLNGNNVAVSGMSFNLNLNNVPSCTLPLKIDVLDDNNTEFIPKTTSDNFECTFQGGTGCFNISENLNEGYIRQMPYCEKIGLTQSTRFKIGAWVKKGSTAFSPDLLEMSLYDLDGERLRSCYLLEPSISGGEISCVVNYTNTIIQDYYVCVKAKSDTDYIIKAETRNPCGFHSSPPYYGNYTGDYYLFAIGAKFSSIGNLRIDEREYSRNENPGTLAGHIDDYLADRYSRACSGNCSIPMKFKAYGNTAIDIFNLSLSYSTSSISPLPERKIYDTEKKAARINSGFLNLDLSLANISVPSSYGNHSVALFLNNQEILTKSINVASVPVINHLVYPFISAGVSIRFTANVSSPAGRNISVYRWNFGDGKNESTSANSVLHTYSSIREYILELEVEDGAGFKASRKFNISAGNPKQVANLTIIKYKARLSNLSREIESFPAWYKNLAKQKIGFDRLQDETIRAERKFNAAFTDSEYVSIMANLTALEVPISLKESARGSFPVFVDFNKINLDRLEEIGAGSEREGDMKKAIGLWTEKNLKMSLDFSYISAYYDDRIDEVLGVFSLKITSQKDNDKEFYVVIGKKDITFDQDYKTKQFDDAVGITFSDTKTREIKFVASNVIVSELAVFISPEFSDLEAEEKILCKINGVCEEGESWRNCRKDCKPWGIASILVLGVLVFGVLAYLFLQWWYKVKYESRLFMNRSDVYNILNFISNARSQGIKDSEIVSGLKKSGWNGEQVSYVLKKMEGRAIMPFDFVKLFKGREKKFV